MSSNPRTMALPDASGVERRLQYQALERTRSMRVRQQTGIASAALF